MNLSKEQYSELNYFLKTMHPYYVCIDYHTHSQKIVALYKRFIDYSNKKNNNEDIHNVLGTISTELYELLTEYNLGEEMLYGFFYPIKIDTSIYTDKNDIPNYFDRYAHILMDYNENEISYLKIYNTIFIEEFKTYCLNKPALQECELYKNIAKYPIETFINFPIPLYFLVNSKFCEYINTPYKNESIHLLLKKIKFNTLFSSIYIQDIVNSEYKNNKSSIIGAYFVKQLANSTHIPYRLIMQIIENTHGDEKLDKMIRNKYLYQYIPKELADSKTYSESRSRIKEKYMQYFNTWDLSQIALLLDLYLLFSNIPNIKNIKEYGKLNQFGLLLTIHYYQNYIHKNSKEHIKKYITALIFLILNTIQNKEICIENYSANSLPYYIFMDMKIATKDYIYSKLPENIYKDFKINYYSNESYWNFIYKDIKQGL
ncbi:MAG: hypothetical protein ACI4V7_03010 [Succinivibrionaceae bacterium]